MIFLKADIDTMELDPFHLFLIILALLFTLCSAVNCCLAYFSGNASNSWFNHNRQDIANDPEYDTEITPANWVHGIWAVIFIWLVLWLVWHLMTICKRRKDLPHGPVSDILLAEYNLALSLLNVSYFAYDRKKFVGNLMALLLTSAIIIICLTIHIRNALQLRREFFQTYRTNFIWNHVLTQNGLTLFATWTGLEVLPSLAVILISQSDANQNVACGLSLAVFAFMGCVIIIIEYGRYAEHLNYIFTHWCVIIWGLSGSVAGNSDHTSSGVFITLCLFLGLSVLMFIMKVILVIQRYTNIRVPARQATVAHKYPSIQTMRGNNKNVKLRSGLHQTFSQIIDDDDILY